MTLSGVMKRLSPWHDDNLGCHEMISLMCEHPHASQHRGLSGHPPQPLRATLYRNGSTLRILTRFVALCSCVSSLLFLYSLLGEAFANRTSYFFYSIRSIL